MSLLLPFDAPRGMALAASLVDVMAEGEEGGLPETMVHYHELGGAVRALVRFPGGAFPIHLRLAAKIAPAAVARSLWGKYSMSDARLAGRGRPLVMDTCIAHVAGMEIKQEDEAPTEEVRPGCKATLAVPCALRRDPGCKAAHPVPCAPLRFVISRYGCGLTHLRTGPGRIPSSTRTRR